MPTRFAHVNVIARDWRTLAAFYQDVFDCKLVPPERDQSGEWLDRATGVPDAHIHGVHLRLPGGGSTLEIYEYGTMTPRPEIKPNTPGFSHIAFKVDSVEAMSSKAMAHGGSVIGEIERVSIAGAGDLLFQYVADPEGNIIELQRWS